MNIIFHIGTHKTASSSLQRFFTGHRELLAKHGYYYPPTHTGTKNFNYLASQIAHEVKHPNDPLFDQIRKQAEEKQCHSVLISAESFYAMTTFFVDIQKRERTHKNYFENEASLIKHIKEQCHGYENIQIACYFRPQDEFAMSLYNQMVKNRFGLSCHYASFVENNAYMFDYQGHIKQWEHVFGKNHIHCRNFLSLKKNIIEDFCEHFLTPEIYQQADRKEYFDNLRLTRDLLEYKRRFNKVIRNRAVHHMATTALMAQAKTSAKEPFEHHIYAPYKKRKALFASFEKGNQELCKNHDMSELPVLIKKEDSNYSGLTQQRASQISNEFRKWQTRPTNIFVFQMRRILNILLRKSPALDRILSPVRRYRSIIQHRLIRNK